MPLPGRHLYASELTGSAELVWLLQVTWAGRTFRWASQPIEITDSAGQTRQFAGGLAPPDLTDELELFDLDADERSAAVEVDFPIDVAAWVQQGRDLTTASGELAIIVSGSTYEDREVLVSGRVVEPSYGEDGETTQLTLEERPYEDRGSLFGPGAKVTTDTWSDALSNGIGVEYMFVFGTPGDYKDAAGTDSQAAATPVRIVEHTAGAGNKAAADTILVNGVRSHATGATLIYEENDGTNGEGYRVWDTVTVSLTTTADGLGRDTETADVSGKTTEVRKGWPYYLCWDGTAVAALKTGGGVYTPYGVDDTIHGAGDLIRYMLELSTLRVDWGAWEALRPTMNRWRLGGFIDENVVPWEWLADNVFPLLPITIKAGTRGLFPVWWAWDATASNAVDHIDDWVGIEPVSRVSYDKELIDVRPELQIRWAFDLRRRRYLRDTWYVADADTSDPEQHETLHSRVGMSRFATVAPEDRPPSFVRKLDSEIIYDMVTVGLIAEWRLIRDSAQHRSITLRVPQRYAWLPLGAPVTITRSAYGWSNRVALVQSVQRTDARSLDVRLVLVEDPARDLFSV